MARSTSITGRIDVHALPALTLRARTASRMGTPWRNSLSTAGQPAGSREAASGKAMGLPRHRSSRILRSSNRSRKPGAAGACHTFSRNRRGLAAPSRTRKTEARAVAPSGRQIVSRRVSPSGQPRADARCRRRPGLRRVRPQSGMPGSVHRGRRRAGVDRTARQAPARMRPREAAHASRRQRPPATARCRRSAASESRRIADAGDAPPP